MKTVKVEYIESGAFQGGEEDVFLAGIKYGEICVVLHVEDYENLRAALKRAIQVFDDEHNDPKEYPFRQDWEKSLNGKRWKR